MAKRISMADGTADRNEINSAKPSGEMGSVIELFSVSKFHGSVLSAASD
jgi:hypothetical protein